MQKLNDGFLINLEGGEGCGKTTHVPYLVEYLREKGFTVYPTREPGGTSIGEQIRDVIHDLKNVDIHPRTETLLYQAARSQIVEQVIRPKLLEGQIIICDRFYDSTIAYQGFGHQQDIKAVHRLVDYATGGLTPDLTILLDVDVEVGQRRKESSDEWNRMDAMDKEFHERVRKGYLKMAEVDARWIVINANNGIQEVRRDLLEGVNKRLELFLNLVEGVKKSAER
ncbi:MAG: Thymidylate kinase [Candidatus Woesebacteria bacterium GW2011_GWA1_33_30]|uniref:Thymidylate kinase n=1 Tax=Candidatus Woesebacteria bacterium GW2011_GWA2_33_28 TaxID=1618561 RepID=A0A0F9ZUB7_9BACT|nr:MAG: Thymidylate kinase [Candidatus Woesebacteria bacterium GW2011_GWA2_33_28]KKP48781.1 MAG: Thymidylate kinase [Candidatus Woesebacteria bacterium GW2011_GWA1_33_30]KKP50054.1 MAG: Thymidylate kinase [Microgenomates group bacterium GW2011_GWC1_33_32]KKP51825.1 MAG: Thymidylate kinase [Candidatus Woesebacteria bacterium GW2011_GWB1_33_38]KKP57825.1 MAG: Thymidylate kinase [Microgenomates group bacterium GW2011_GWD1_33_9]